GGDGGKIIEQSIDWAKKKELERMTLSEFKTCIKENNLNIENRDFKKLRQEINRKLNREN
ncbi:MAG: hypothetical protein ACXADU_17460, partial [Promethearchaeota archaeon]